jgi:hypothetical protein
MSSESPPTLETVDSENLLDYLRHNAGTAIKTRKAVLSRPVVPGRSAPNHRAAQF